MKSDANDAEKHAVDKSARTTVEYTGVNASGHVQELDRHFGLLSIIGTGVTVGAAWPAIGGSIVSQAVSTASWPRPLIFSGHLHLQRRATGSAV